MRIARVTVDLMRPVPVAPLTIESEVLREGRKILPERALEILAAAPPDVMNHNLETVPRLYRQARPEDELVCQFHGFVGVARHLRLDGRDTVGGEDLLRLELGKDGTARVAGGIYDLPYPPPGRIVVP